MIKSRKNRRYKVTCWLRGKMMTKHFFRTLKGALRFVHAAGPRSLVVCVVSKREGRKYRKIGRYKGGRRIRTRSKKTQAFGGFVKRVRTRKVRKDKGKSRPKVHMPNREHTLDWNSRFGGRSFHYGSKRQKRMSFKPRSRGKKRRAA